VSDAAADERLPMTVVVPTRDRPTQLRRGLDALTSSIGAADEIVVVDSASRDSSTADVAASFGVRSVRCDRPGASRARNVGADAARHAFIAYIDDDVTVSPWWADAMARAIASGEDTAFVTGRVAVKAEHATYQRPVALVEGDTALTLTPDVVTPGNSANLALRRDALVRVGGWDEALGGGAVFEAAEDLDLFDRLFAAGMSGRYAPDALAWHDQWRTRRELIELDWRYGIGAGARLAKLRRIAPERARRVFRENVWHGDLADVARLTRRWEEFAVLTTLIRLAGTAVGFARARGADIDDTGRFAVR
jgi:glycosyltransferase involved in cell wall biosynthesis